MYARPIVESRIEQSEKELGFKLEYHTPLEIDLFEERLESKYVDAYATARRAAQGSKTDGGRAYQISLIKSLANPEDPKLSSEEIRWMKNERALCVCDAEYFLTSYYWIKTPTKVIRFEFRAGQRIFFNVIQQMQLAGAPIEIIMAKARQLGISTVTEGLMLHSVNYGYGVNAVVASADPAKTGKMAHMTLDAYDALSWWNKIPYSRKVESQSGMLELKASRSVLSFQHGSQTSGISRGDTVLKYHLCLSGRTLVRTGNSTVKPIRELVSGETTIGVNGERVRIKSAWKSPRHKEITSEIEVWGTPTVLSCTRDHKVLESERGWVEAKDINKGDFLVYPVRPILATQKPAIQNFRKYDGVWGKAPRSAQQGPEIWEPTFALGRLAGLYLAEGSIQYTAKKVPGAVYFAIHQDEIPEVESWMKATFGADVRAIMRRKNSKSAVIAIGRRGFAHWLIDNFGTTDDKRLPDFCWSMGREFARGVVAGYLFGDGHYAARDNSVLASSIRVAIPIGIRELIASLGFGWSQIAWREAGEFYNRNCRQIWILTIAGETAIKLRSDFSIPTHEIQAEPGMVHWRWGSGGIEVQVSDTGNGFSEDFYDIEVDSADHAFLTVCGIVHNSECASYTNAVEQIEAALWKCVHPDPAVLGILESSAEGKEGWFHDNYWDNKIRRQKGRPSRLLALFLPFTVAADQYPNPTWIRVNPIPSDWKPEKETYAMMKRATDYLHTNPMLEKVLGANWQCGREQAWYWECHYLEARAKGTEKLWYQEMPVSDEEAFQSKYESVFGKETIAELDSHRERSYQVFGIIGQSIEDRFEPAHEDIEAEDLTEPDAGRIVQVSYLNRIKQLSYKWELLPLLWKEPFNAIDSIRSDDNEQMGKFFVYEEPKPGYDYSIGMRTGNGIGIGQSVVAVAQRGRHAQEQDVQAAEWRSDEVSHIEAWAWCLAIAAYYSRFMGRDEYGTQIGLKREPYLAIEQIQQAGDTAQFQMRKMGYRRFHKMVRYDGASVSKAGSNRIGWYSSGWSTPMYTDSFVVLVRNGWYKINSPYTIWEADHWEQRETASGKAKYEHSEGTTDTGLLANAMAAFCVNDLKPMAERTLKQRFDGPGAVKPRLDLTPTVLGTSFSLSDYNTENIERYLRGTRRISF